MNTAKDVEYNGWRNKATWNANLWLANEEPLYRRCMELAGRHMNNGDLADHIEAFAIGCWPTGRTPDNQPLNLVYWQDIADAFAES